MNEVKSVYFRRVNLYVCFRCFLSQCKFWRKTYLIQLLDFALTKHSCFAHEVLGSILDQEAEKGESRNFLPRCSHTWERALISEHRADYSVS
jgi:hypothetical protein